MRPLFCENSVVLMLAMFFRLDVFFRILVEILFAAFAAELHFLAFEDEHERLAHVAAEFLFGDGAGFEQVRHGIGVGVRHRRGH